MADQNLAVEASKEHRENRKKNIGRKVESNQALAVAKFLRVPPRKARFVLDEVRGKYVLEALAFLRYIPNRAGGFIGKVVFSAASNAVNNHGLRQENLRIVEARADEGPRIKRMQPRAQGRAYSILKRTSHITIIVEDAGPRARKPRKASGTRAAAARAAREAQNND
jgi:large subunit ribosomal protein L22